MDPLRRPGRKLVEAIVKWGGLAVAVALLIGGVMINWSSKTKPFVTGVGVETDCKGADEAFMNVIVRTIDIYELYLVLPRGAWQDCKKIRITPPASVLSVRRMERDGAVTNGKRLTSGRTPIPFQIAATSFGPPAIDIDPKLFSDQGVRLELIIGGGIQSINFEKFSLVLPAAVRTHGSDLAPVPIKIDVLGLAPDLDLGDVRPAPANRFSRIGYESLSFGRVELGELNVQFTSPWRADFRYFYNQLAIGLVFAMIGAWCGWLYARR